MAHNSIVTITYPNGTVLKAIVLSHDEQAIRAIAPGCTDVLSFTELHGIWFSDELEPVTIKFEWQRPGVSSIPAAADCICSKELAAKLIHLLVADDDGVEVRSDGVSALTEKATG
jgi:hypothetical protein